MARAWFGGSVADFVISAVAPGDPLRFASGVLTLWDAETGGTQHADLILDGAAVSSINVGDDGQIPSFQGPDDVLKMWAQVGTGSRVLVVALGDIIDRAGEAAVRAEDARDAAQAAAAEATGVQEVNGIAPDESGNLTLGASDVGARAAGNVPWGEVSGKPSTFTPSAHSHTAADLPAASTSGPGIVEAATDAERIAGVDTARYITPKQLADAIAAILNSPPSTLDTLDELAAALGDDPNFAATMAAALAGKQPLDSDLSQIAALTSAADRLLYATGPQAWALATFTAFARTLLDDADASAARGTLDAASSSGGGREKSAALSATAGTCTGDLSVASVFTITPTGNWTLAFSNVPASGTACTVTVIVNEGATARTMTQPTGATFVGSPAPAVVASKVRIYTYLTVNGGATWYASAVVQP